MNPNIMGERSRYDIEQQRMIQKEEEDANKPPQPEKPPFKGMQYEIMRQELERDVLRRDEIASSSNQRLENILGQELRIDGAGTWIANGKYIKLDASCQPNWAISSGWSQEQWEAVTEGCPWYEKHARTVSNAPLRPEEKCCVYYYSIEGNRKGWHLVNSNGVTVYFIRQDRREESTEPPFSGTLAAVAERSKERFQRKKTDDKGWQTMGWGQLPAPTHSVSLPV